MDNKFLLRGVINFLTRLTLTYKRPKTRHYRKVAECGVLYNLHSTSCIASQNYPFFHLRAMDFVSSLYCYVSLMSDLYLAVWWWQSRESIRPACVGPGIMHHVAEYTLILLCLVADLAESLNTDIGPIPAHTMITSRPTVWLSFLGTSVKVSAMEGKVRVIHILITMVD